ncbi:MAG: YhbY family RNA-binding protein [Nanoarchaeota archaeon]|nr:YhbY family RNA-binding protein [Nanoarchaeota archaeon]
MIKGEIKFQVGKSGINSGVIESLRLAFKTRKVVRIYVLKSSVRDRGKLREMAKEISEKLHGNYDQQSVFRYKIIGFTIVMKKVKIK